VTAPQSGEAILSVLRRLTSDEVNVCSIRDLHSEEAGNVTGQRSQQDRMFEVIWSSE